jgi:mRNA interferase MazF
MGRFVAGDVVVIPFPSFPAANADPLLLSPIFRGNHLPNYQQTKIRFPRIAAADFIAGMLPVDSFIRPNKTFTADKRIILFTAGRASTAKADEGRCQYHQKLLLSLTNEQLAVSS